MLYIVLGLQNIIYRKGGYLCMVMDTLVMVTLDMDTMVLVVVGFG